MAKESGCARVVGSQHQVCLLNAAGADHEAQAKFLRKVQEP